VPIATPIAVNDVIQMKFFCNDTRQNGINVVGYLCTGLTVPGVTDQNIADAMSTNIAPLYRAYLNIGHAYAGAKAQIIRPVIRPYVTTVLGNGIGTQVGDQLPTQVAFLLSPRTAIAGRRGRGRTYLPFWSELYNNGTSSPTAAAITAATNWSNQIFATVNVTVGPSTATLVPVIVGRGPIPTNTPVTHVVVRVQWATQRRRSLITKSDVLGP